MKPNKTAVFHAIICLVCAVIFQQASGQAELQPWGNLTGIRTDGQLMEFESNLLVAGSDWSAVKATGKERQRPKFLRQGNKQTVLTNIDSFYFKEEVEDAGKGVAKVHLEVKSTAASAQGVYFGCSLPAAYYAQSIMQVDGKNGIPLSSEDKLNAYLQKPIRTLSVVTKERQFRLTFTDPVMVLIKKPSKEGIAVQVYVSLLLGNSEAGANVVKDFTIQATGRIDRNPVSIAINTAKTGRVFDGLGGNFRLQNAKTDPQVIDYCLKNLQVNWGRVEMPWRFWQPAVDTNPIAQAKAGKLHPAVQKAMEMAQRLGKMGMPVVLTAWSAPAWAIVGKPKFRPGPDGVWGNPLDTTKTKGIYQSIVDYIIYLKEQYGVEISLFSFNESDLGINIRQTGQEHAELIKGLGAAFAAKGLKTKLLLGDNSDATTYDFIYPALNDAGTHPYIGAVSFHSWRGWETATLQKWADAATQLQLPLLVGEGSIDAAAWAYPAIFEEPLYALQEIGLYLRLLTICQPASILQWQLTADYSPLAGGGIFGNNEPLHPTQRFWNLKQLSSTPKGLQAISFTGGHSDISCAVLGDTSKNIYAVHLVNNGATRKVTITGIPEAVKAFTVYVTDKTRGMEKGLAIPVADGKAVVTLDSQGFTTLTNKDF